MNHFRGLMIGVGLFLLGNSSAFAWNDLGHITVAQIAYRQLSGDERLAVIAILKQHPHFNTYFRKPDGLDMPDDEWLFLRAATWCDYVRPPRDSDRSQIQTHPLHKFHRGPWHYINYPFKVGDALGAPLAAPLPPTEDDQTDIVQQLKLTREILRRQVTDDPGIAQDVTPEQNQAVRLCWLFHLVGDLHQPLHATALVDARHFPGPHHGDAGGNLIIVRLNSQTRISNLHAFWDGLLGTVAGWRDVSDVGKLAADVRRCRNQADLLSHGALAADKLTELQQHPKFVEWAEESFRAAAAVAYDGGRLQFATKKDVDDQRVAKDQVPMLPPVLQEKARATANKRIALAGYRLASQLQGIVGAN
ncbi:MAG: hypothetical protein JWN70_4418 [Planctomycetaceae bacterium]|nr:hypothetical protein [Planctomycetaceae bacterium]